MGGGRRRGIPVGDGSKTSFIEKDTAGIGALADIGCYSLDMVLNAIGYPKPLTVSGFKTDYFGKNPKTFCDKIDPQHLADVFGVDDFAGAFVRLEGGGRRQLVGKCEMDGRGGAEREEGVHHRCGERLRGHG